MNTHKIRVRSLFVSITALLFLTVLTACGGGGGDDGVKSFTVTGVAGPNGTVAPATQKVDAGETATLTVTPADGYLIASVAGCGGVLSGNTYTTAAIQANCTVNATFTSLILSASFSASSDGSFSVAVPDSDVTLFGMVVPEGTKGLGELMASPAWRATDVKTIDGAIIELRGDRDPQTRGMKTLTVKIKAPGFSTFVRKFEDVSGKIQLNAELALSSGLREIDIASLETSSLTRDGRSTGTKRVDAEERVTIQMLQNNKTGAKRARVMRSSEGTPSSMDPTESVLVDYSFPLKGLRVAESSTRLLAEVAYLDSPNNPETMPGGFVAEGEGDSQIDMMVTFGASQIELFDDAGNKLLTDPSDRTTDVTVRMLVPREAYFSLQDEEPENEQSVSVPYYYFDEVLQKWVLHRDADGKPAYSHLQDQFGNVLTPRDLVLLKHTRDASYDVNGNKLIDPETQLEMESNIVLDPQYAPEGVDPQEVRIYSVNKVHHFTTWNCDRGDRAHSYQFDIKDKSGRKVNPRVRIGKRNGGNTSDTCQTRNGRCNVHTDRDVSKQADALIKLYLDRALSAEERAEFFERLKRSEDPRHWNAFIEALKRYGENLYNDIATDDSGGDFGRGIRKIFSNETINGAFINTDGVDCVQTPDICRSIIAAAGEQVNKSKTSQQAVAFLMEIAVDAYNPSKIADVGYFVDKGIGMLDITMQMDGVATDLKGVYDNYGKVKKAASIIRAAMSLRNGKWAVNPDKWDQYWEAANDMKDGLQAMQDLASKAGDKSSWFGRRTARDLDKIRALSPPPMSEESLLALDMSIMREVENFGGLWFGGNQFAHQGYQWGHFVQAPYGSPDYYALPKFVMGSAPAVLLPGGTSIAYLEYFDGTQWTMFPDVSDTGADPLFLPVTGASSYGNGTAENPVIYLGTFTIDVPLDVTVSGKVVNQSGNPISNLSVSLNGNLVTTDAAGQFTGTADSIGDYVVVSFGNYSRSYPIDRENKSIDTGEVTVYQGINWSDTPYTVGGLSIDPNERQAAVTISGKPYYGNDKVLYEYRLDRTWYFSSSTVAPLTQGTIETDAPFEFTFDLNEYLPRVGEGAFTGSYYLTINAFTSDTIDPSRPTSSRTITFNVKNHAPEIVAFDVNKDSDKLGAKIDVTLTATDQDGVSNLSGVSIYALCKAANGYSYQLWAVRQSDTSVPDTVNGNVMSAAGSRTLEFEIDTSNMRYLWALDSDSFDCTITPQVTDKSWSSAEEQKYAFTLAQNPVDPTIYYNYVAADYVVTQNANIYPSSSAYFQDMNNDIVSYTVDCGYDTEGNPASGEDAVGQTSPTPIYYLEGTSRGCRYDVYPFDAETGRYDTTKPGPMAGKEFTFSYTATDSRGGTAVVTSKVKVLMPLRVELTNEDGSPLIETVQRAVMCSANEVALDDPTVCNDQGERLTCDEEGANCTAIMQPFELPVELPSGVAAERKMLIAAVSGNADGTVSNKTYSVYHRASRGGWWSQNITSETQVGADNAISVPLKRPGIYTVYVNAAEYQKDPDTGEAVGNARFSVYYSREIVVTSTYDIEISVDGLLPEAFIRQGLKFITDQPTRFAAEILEQPDPANWDPKYQWTLTAFSADEGVPPVVTQPCSDPVCMITFDTIGDYQIEVEVYNAKDPTDTEGARPTIVKNRSFWVYKRPQVTPGSSYTPRVPGEVTVGDQYTATVTFDPALVQRTQWIVQRLTDSGWVNSSSHSIISTLPESLSLVFNETGTYRVVSVVTTKDGVTASFPGDEIIVTQYAPELTSITADALEVSPGGVVVLTATGNDPDARDTDRLGFEWLLDGALLRSTTSEEAVGADKSSEGSLTWTLPLSQGERNYVMGVRVVDATGRRSEANNLTVKAVFKGPKVTVATAPQDATGTKPLKVTFTATVTKGDAEITKYQWRSDTGAPVDQTALQKSVWTYTYNDHGTYSARLKVIDDNGKYAEVTIPVTVLDYAPPTNVFITTVPEPAVGNFPLEVDFTANATPGDGTLTKYEWQPRAGAEWVVRTVPDYSFTYMQPGNYVARLRITDSNGKVSQEAAKAITVIDPDALENVTITFKERRADGLGPEYLYPQDGGGEYQHEGMGAPDFVHVPMVNNQLNWSARNVQKVESTSLNFNQFGLFGVSSMHWTSVEDSLLLIDTSGNYDMGVSVFEVYDENSEEVVSLKNVAGEYTCGYIAYGDNGSELYGTTTLAEQTIWPNAMNRGVDDTLQVLAFLGTGRADYNGTCTYTYAGVTSGTASPYVLPEAPVALVPLNIIYPEIADTSLSMQIANVNLVDAGGRAFYIYRTNLPKNEAGFQLPLIPGRTVKIQVELLKQGQYGQTIVSTVNATAALEGNAYTLDLSVLKLSGTTGMVLKNSTQGFSMKYAEADEDFTVVSSVYSGTAGDFTFGSFLQLEAPTEVFFKYDPQAMEQRAFTFIMPYADFNAAFGGAGYPVINVGQYPAIVQDVKPGPVTATVNTEQKVVQVSFPDAQGDGCNFQLRLNYLDESTQDVYSRTVSFILKPALGGLSVPIPYVTNVWDNEGNFVEAELDKVQDGVLSGFCARFIEGETYESFVREILANFDSYDMISGADHLLSRYAGGEQEVLVPQELPQYLSPSTPVVNAGESVTISIGGGPIDDATYVWSVNGKKVDGASGSSFVWAGSAMAGEFVISVAITSPEVIGLPISTTVIVRDPATQQYDFALLQARADGLGPVLGLERQNGEDDAGSKPDFLDVRNNMLSTQLLDKSLFTFATGGLFGTRLVSEYEREVDDVLYEVKQPGIYKIGVADAVVYSENVALPTQSPSYDCGLVVYGSAHDHDYPNDGQNGMYFFSGAMINNVPVNIKARDMTSDGKVFVVAMLGNYSYPESACYYDYAGSYFGHHSAIALPETSAQYQVISPAFDSSLVAADVEFGPDFVEFTRGGVTVGVQASLLPRNAPTMEVKVPVLADTSYTVGFSHHSGWAEVPMMEDYDDAGVMYRYVASGLAVADLGTLDLTNVKLGNPLVITNVDDLGDTTLHANARLTLSGNKTTTIASKLNLSAVETTTSAPWGDHKLPALLYFDNAAAQVHVSLEYSDGPPVFGFLNTGDYLIPAAVAANKTVLDVLAPPITEGLAISNFKVELSGADAAFKLSYNTSPQVRFCVIMLQGMYEGYDGLVAYRNVEMLVDGSSKTSLLIPYARPATSYYDWDLIRQVNDPAYPAPSAANAAVVCGDAQGDADYATILASRFANYMPEEIFVDPLVDLNSYVSSVGTTVVEQ